MGRWEQSERPSACRERLLSTACTPAGRGAPQPAERAPSARAQPGALSLNPGTLPATSREPQGGPAVPHLPWLGDGVRVTPLNHLPRIPGRPLNSGLPFVSAASQEAQRAESASAPGPYAPTGGSSQAVHGGSGRRTPPPHQRVPTSTSVYHTDELPPSPRSWLTYRPRGHRVSRGGSHLGRLGRWPWRCEGGV